MWAALAVLVSLYPTIAWDYYNKTYIICPCYWVADNESSSRFAGDILKYLPSLCSQESNEKSLINLAYGTIQSVYWNLGFFNYYELKQIPNFILAFPAIFIAFNALVNGWILWKDSILFIFTFKDEKEVDGFHSCFRYKNLKVYSLLRTSSKTNIYFINVWDNCTIISESTNKYLRDMTEDELKRSWLITTYMESSIYFSFSAFSISTSILIATLLVFAHIQVSTRILFSSSPLFLLYLASELAKPNSHQQSRDLKKFIAVYLILYNLLGAILHGNFLPWT